MSSSYKYDRPHVWRRLLGFIGFDKDSAGTGLVQPHLSPTIQVVVPLNEPPMVDVGGKSLQQAVSGTGWYHLVVPDNEAWEIYGLVATQDEGTFNIDRVGLAEGSNVVTLHSVTAGGAITWEPGQRVPVGPGQKVSCYVVAFTEAGLLSITVWASVFKTAGN